MGFTVCKVSWTENGSRKWALVESADGPEKARDLAEAVLGYPVDEIENWMGRSPARDDPTVIRVKDRPS